MLGSITFTDEIPAGTKLYLAAWRNTGERGDYLSLRATWPREQPSESAGRPAPRARVLDDEIPF